MCLNNRCLQTQGGKEGRRGVAIG